ncbi:MAG: SAM-dependent methyltransferase, partial [Stellaceae bacterium]
MNPWLAVIGLGEDGLPGLAPAARALIETAEVLAGGARHLAMVPQNAAERLPWERPLARTVAALAARRGRRVVVLASGDPLWYGVGVTLA